MSAEDAKPSPRLEHPRDAQSGSSDEAARHFYTKLGFQLLGSARDYAPGKTMDDSDVVLKLIINLS
jgi:hypothetical protein